MPLIDPFRLVIAKAVTEALREITPANGYQSDLSDFVVDGETQSRVFRGRAIFGANDPDTMVSILEPAVAPEQMAAPADVKSRRWDFDLLLQGFVADDAVNPTDPAYILLADVKKRLAQEWRAKLGNQPNPFGLGVGNGSGNVIEELRIGPGVVRPADEVSDKAYFWLNLTLRIVENIENPFP